MAKTKVQALTEEPEQEEEVYGNVYQQWITINNHSTGTIEVTIRQYGKPPGGDPPPGGS